MTQPQTTRCNTAQYPAASLTKRAGAIFYDLLIVLAILFIATIFWTGWGVTFGHPWYRAYIAFVYLVIFVYFSWCWIHGGQTVGMKAWKIKLVSCDTRRFSWAAAMTRSAAAVISAAALGAGFWWALLDPQHRSWHDRLSGSRLIQL